MYIEIGNEPEDTVDIAFTFDPDLKDSTRSWDIKVTQIPCGAIYAAPNDCLQYFTGLTGTIKTFNFDDPSDNHLPNHEYSACMRQEKGFCCVEYSICPDTTFQLGGSDSVNSPENAMQDELCLSVDYIAIPS